jgi:hypothetical protein
VNYVIGDKIGETKGKRLVRRVLSTDPPTAEVSFEDSGLMFGVDTTGMGTYTSVIHPDGSIHGQGQGLIMTSDGEMVSWTGTGSANSGLPARSAIAACSSSEPLPKASPASTTPAAPSNTT